MNNNRSNESRGGFPVSAKAGQLRNYIYCAIEGGLYSGGLAFVATDTVLPNLVNSFGGPEWLIIIAPLMQICGVMAPQLIAAHWIERLDAVHRYTIIMGFFQRLPYLLAAIVLFTWGNSHPHLAMGCAISAPFLSGIFTGATAPAWSELISRMIAPERRASLHALRNTVGAFIALFGGWAIHSILEAYPGYRGYSILFATAFAFIMLSWIGFRQLREVPLPERVNRATFNFAQSIGHIPSLLRADPQLRLMCITSFLSPSIFLVVPFAAVHATDASGLGESFVGWLVVAKTIGIFIGNLMSALLGDRFGGRLPLVISRILRILFCVGIPLAQSQTTLLLLFCIYGMSFTLNMVGSQVLTVELSPDGKRPTYFGIISLASLPTLLLIPVISTLIRAVSQELRPLALFALTALVIDLAVLLKIKEPRGPFRAE